MAGCYRPLTGAYLPRSLRRFHLQYLFRYDLDEVIGCPRQGAIVEMPLQSSFEGRCGSSTHLSPFKVVSGSGRAHNHNGKYKIFIFSILTATAPIIQGIDTPVKGPSALLLTQFNNVTVIQLDSISRITS